jgi:large subunit ribosomal protein L25
MDALELKAEPRDVVGRHVKGLRQQGFVPVILYGRDVESTPLKVEARALTKVLDVAGTHRLIALKVGDNRSTMTLARDIQRDNIKRRYLHVDFFAVKMDEKVTAQVPIVLIGEAPAVKELSGVLTQGLDQLEIECLPGDLIDSIEVDVSNLAEFNASISVSDLRVPGNITVLSDPESMVAKVEPPRIVGVEEELEAREGVSAEPEVITAVREEE